MSQDKTTKGEAVSNNTRFSMSFACCPWMQTQVPPLPCHVLNKAVHWCLVQNTQPLLASHPIPSWSPPLGCGTEGCHPAGMAGISVFFCALSPAPVAPVTILFLHTPIGKAEILWTSLLVAFQGKQFGRITLRYFLCQSQSRYLSRKTQFTPLEVPRGFSFLYKETLKF